MDKKIRAFIFARGGSKGIIKKNLQKIGDIHLVGHSIKIASKLKIIDKIYVSTDCDEIGEISRIYGAEVINRPKNLASDDSPELLSWKHAIDYSLQNDGQFSVFLSLPPTSPLRDIKDILNCIVSLEDNIDIALTMSKSKRSPWFNMVSQNKNKKISLINDSYQISRRQDSPNCYDLTTVAYAAKQEFILNTENIWNGNVVGVEVPEERAMDIDSPLDLKIAKLLYENP